MTKQDILIKLDEAKISHVRWHAIAQALAMGSESVEQAIPISHNDCEFGIWYYSTGQLLAFTRNFSSVGQIHENLHEIYNEIFEKSNHVFHKGMFESQESAIAKKNLELNNLCNKLKKTSKLLMEEILDLENQINKMSPEQIVSRMMSTV